MKIEIILELLTMASKNISQTTLTVKNLFAKAIKISIINGQKKHLGTLYNIEFHGDEYKNRLNIKEILEGLVIYILKIEYVSNTILVVPPNEDFFFISL